MSTDPHAIELARQLQGQSAREREAHYERTGVPRPLRAAVEAFFSGNIETGVPGSAGRPLSDVSTRDIQPSVIGRYKVIRLLGRGGMGEVYLAHDPVLDRELAVKLIGAGINDPDARRRLVDEARAAGRLRHPNIVTIFDAGEHEGNPYIAMEYVVGESVRSLVERRAPFSQGRKLLLMEGACAGLAHAHRENVVHFDVKPDNLMLDGRAGIKVLDFGVARVLKSEALVTQHVAGTLRYMSPEQLTGRPLDRRSDVFSLGCSLFEFIAYEPAYTGTAHEIITRITTGPVPRLSGVLEKVHPTLDALIAKAMSIDPAERFDDLDELARSLRRFRDELDPRDEAWTTSRSVDAMPAPRPAGVSPVSRSQRVSLTVVGIAAALVVGAAAWMWRPALVTREPAVQSAAVQPPPLQPAPTAGASTPDPTRMAGPAQQPASASTSGGASTERRPANEVGARPPANKPIPEPPASTVEPGAVRPPPPPPSSQAIPSAGSTPTGPDAAVSNPLPTPPGTSSSGSPSVVPSSPVVQGLGPATNAASPTDDTSQVLAALGRYRDAYAALDAAAVQRIYPTLAPNLVEQLRRRFESYKTYELALTQPRVDVQNETATVRTLVTHKTIPRVGSPQSSAVETEFRLLRDARGWTITDVKVNR